MRATIMSALAVLLGAALLYADAQPQKAWISRWPSSIETDKRWPLHLNLFTSEGMAEGACSGYGNGGESLPAPPRSPISAAAARKRPARTDRNRCG